MFLLLLLLFCLRLLISLLNGSYWKGGDCLLGCCQLSNLPRRPHGKGSDGETVHPLAIRGSRVMNNVVWPAGLV